MRTIPFLVLILAIVGIVILMYLIKKNDKSGPDAWTPPNTGESEEYLAERYRSETSGSRIHFGDEFSSGISGGAAEPEHFVSKLYVAKQKDYIWICPYCEVENSQSDTVCCVCCQER